MSVKVVLMAQNSKTPLVLVDGSSYLFRAFYALPPLTTREGQPTGAIYGVAKMLQRLILDYHPEKMAVVFDTKGKNFRHDLYPDYKANRTEMPPELAQQIDLLHTLIQAMGLPLIAIPGVEADDVIGTLAREAQRKGIETVISTGDKDMAQLVNEHVTLINTMSDEVLDVAGVKKKFNIPPERIIDYLALIGDTSDNIPGIPKVGPKTAVKWLEKYGDLDTIIAHANDIGGKVGDNLRDNLEQLSLARQLTTIKEDVPLDKTIEGLHLNQPDRAQLKELFQTLEFKNWLTSLEKGTLFQQGNESLSSQPSKAPEVHYETLLSEADFNRWLDKLTQNRRFAFDTETTSLNAMDAELVGLSFACTPYEAAYVPVAHDYEGAPQQLDRDWVLEKIKPLLEDESMTKVLHHLKYDAGVLGKYGIEMKGEVFDTMLESYVLNSTASRHDMDSLASFYLQHQTIHYEDVAGKGAKQIPFQQVPLDNASPYAAEDADVTLRLHESIYPRLSDEPELLSVLTDIELPLVPVLLRMEQKGVLIDKDKLNQQSAALAERLETLEQKVHTLAGGSFNLNSPKQLQEVLFVNLNLPVLQKTPKGQPSTSEAVLQELAHEYELPKLILEYRSLSKLKSTYTDKLPEQIHPRTGRVHTSYHQGVTATGRLSSSEPNLQNIPIRTPEGRQVRDAFIAPEGSVLLAADYSQIELRIMAHLSQDPGLLKAFKEKQDVHRSTAAEVFGVSLGEVTDLQRRHAKAINFGLMYGMSAFGLSQQMEVSRGEAQAFMDTYFKRFPGVQAFMESIREKAQQQGYVETLFNRRLYLPEIRSKNGARRKAAERAAINAPMQGTAADIIKKAMIGLQKALQEKGYHDVHLLMQVHDELIVETPKEHVDAVQEIVRHCMENAAKLLVPLEVAIGVGANWGEAH